MPRDRSSLLIVRAWREEGSDEPLRVRLRATTDVGAGFRRDVLLSDIDEVCAETARWLRAVSAG